MQYRQNKDRELRQNDKAWAAIFALIATCIAAWGTHIVVCIQSSQWLLLIAGAILAPIGVIHGFGWWLGVWN